MSATMPEGHGLKFMQGGGETGALMAAQDWSHSPLGKPGTWPQSLRSVVGLMLNSKFPMFVAWGPELGFLYNDAYSELLGSKHPQALGQPFAQVWADIWPDIAPLVDAALDGEASYHENLPLLTTRKGFEEEAWFTFSYSPVRDESGAVSGVFCAVAETTEAMLNERRQLFRLELGERLRHIADADEIIAVASKTAGRELGVNRVGYGEIDDDEQVAIIARDWTDGSMASIAGQHRLNDFGPAIIAGLRAGASISVDDVLTDPRVAASAFTLINTRSVLIVPLIKDGKFTALLYLHHPSPRCWTEDDRDLAAEVAERTWAAVERSRAEAGLRQRESRLRAIFNQATVGFARTDLSGKFLELNDRFCEMVGHPREELLGLKMQDITHPDDLTNNMPLFATAAAGGPPFEIDKRYVKPDGSTVWVRNSVNAIRSEDGQVEGILAVSIDLTKKRLAEARLRESEDQLRRGLAASRMVVWSFDLVSGLITRSENADEIFGAGSTPEDFFSRMFEEDAEADRARLSAALSGATARYESEFRYRHPDGQLFWLYNQGEVTRKADGKPKMMYGVCIDVTARKEAELGIMALNETLEQRISQAVAAQREVDALYRAYFENTPEALFVIGVEPDGGFVVEETNPAHEAGIGLRLEDIRGQRIEDILPEQLAQDVLKTYRNVVETGAIYQYREQYYIKGATSYWDTSIIPMRNEQGRITRLIGSSRDVTRQVVAEETLRQSQKMEAIGQLTGGVAHDFNNLLTPIIGALDLLKRRGVGGERERQLMDAAAQSADRAKTLVQRLLAFARRQPLQAVPVDLRTLVENMADLVDSTTGPQVSVVVDVADAVPPAMADANQVEMALLNLAVNARDAMADGGTLLISLSAETIGDQNTLGLNPGDYVRLSVEDNGVGMDDDIARQAIEPFFSTKGVGKGTGLGLSMVHGLAAQLGGALEISTQKEMGTKVSLLLPVSSTTVKENVSQDVIRTEARYGGTVLLVDDEALVRMMTADMLSELGFSVVEAHSAEHALDLVGQGLNPTLLMTDHLMPGMTGPELAQALRHNMPDLKVLIISGYADIEGMSPDLPRLTKPYLSEDLIAALADLDMQ
ncbi:PAS domain S-box protein [Sphingorhabdus sp.]|uniref:PAS domain S-box protein n=1 Tax=Sphingorhabdus sp. TaxID=1902408 RepID=UPI00391B395E